MKLKNGNSLLFFHEITDRKMICFGTSQYTGTFCRETACHNWLEQVIFFVDNRTFGTKFECQGYSWNVNHPDVLKKLTDEIIIICAEAFESIYNIAAQLQNMGIPDTVECYALRMIMSEYIYDNSAIHALRRTGIKIDKTIHSFWFSKEKKPQKYQACIDSWKRLCPEFEIKEWNSDNYDIAKSRYMKQAYEKKMWAFVSDYARLDVIYQHGGIYFDMDVELLKPVNDLLMHEAFFSFDEYHFVDLGTGFGAVKGHRLVGNLLKAYENLEFVYDDENADISKIIPQPALLLPVFEKFGYERNHKSQVKRGGVVFYSPDYFRVIADSSHGYRCFRGNEYAVHWHHAGWVDQETYAAREKKFAYMKRVRKMFDEYPADLSVRG